MSIEPEALKLVERERDIFTTLDFVLVRLEIPSDVAVEQVIFHFIGRMEVQKTLFVNQAYKTIVQPWTFLQKKSCDPQIEPVGEAVCSFRINVRLPAGTCPVGDFAHDCLPPSLNCDKLKSGPAKEVRIEYLIAAQIMYKDGTSGLLELPFEFLPQKRAAPEVTRDTCRLGEEQSTRKSVTERILSSLQASVGELEINSMLPGMIFLSADARTFNIKIDLEFLWHGSRKRLPDLRSVHASIKTYQSAVQYHHHEGDPRNPPLLIDTWSLGKQSLPMKTEYPYFWSEFASEVWQSQSTIELSYTSDTTICPTFTCCLASRTYKLQLKFNLNFPHMTIGRERSVTVEIPLGLKAAVPNAPDPDRDFIERWNKGTAVAELAGDDALEYWKSDTRRPLYGEAIDTQVCPAPSREPPQYRPDPPDPAELARVPAWQGKE